VRCDVSPSSSGKADSGSGVFRAPPAECVEHLGSSSIQQERRPSFIERGGISASELEENEDDRRPKRCSLCQAKRYKILYQCEKCPGRLFCGSCVVNARPVSCSEHRPVRYHSREPSPPVIRTPAPAPSATPRPSSSATLQHAAGDQTAVEPETITLSNPARRDQTPQTRATPSASQLLTSKRSMLSRPGSRHQSPRHGVSKGKKPVQQWAPSSRLRAAASRALDRMRAITPEDTLGGDTGSEVDRVCTKQVDSVCRDWDAFDPPTPRAN
jgi:hypothetical protein